MTARASANPPPRTFVDSNILVYSRDNSAGWKQKVAQQALDELWQHACGTLSNQVLQEFYWNVVRKIDAPLVRDVAREIVEDYFVWCGQTTVNEIREAFELERTANISFWDALIVACARKNGATRILTEDMNHGQIIAGLEIVNPFRNASHAI